MRPRIVEEEKLCRCASNECMKLLFYLQVFASFVDDFLFDQRSDADACGLQWRACRFLLVRLLVVGVFLKVAAVQAHVTVQRRNILKLTMAQVALDGLLFKLYSVLLDAQRSRVS